jgi:hypothetical protein
MNEFLENLKRQAAENPVLALGVAAALLTAVSKVSNSHVNARNAKAWEKEVERRIKNSKK